MFRGFVLLNIRVENKFMKEIFEVDISVRKLFREIGWGNLYDFICYKFEGRDFGKVFR